MTPTECVSLVRLINARCPSMRLDDATPDAWYIDLQCLDATDARAAVIALSRRQAYIALHELLAEAVSIERRRIGAQRAAELSAKIERENAGELHDRPVAALTVGQPISQVLARSVHEAKLRDVQTGTQATGEGAAQREQARLEIERLRQAQQPPADGGTDANA